MSNNTDLYPCRFCGSSPKFSVDMNNKQEHFNISALLVGIQSLIFGLPI